MRWMLDHVFITTTDPVVAEAELATFGLTFLRRTVHAGQGTANVCASFEGSFLELTALRRHRFAEAAKCLVQPGNKTLITWSRRRSALILNCP